MCGFVNFNSSKNRFENLKNFNIIGALSLKWVKLCFMDTQKSVVRFALVPHF